MRLPFLVCATLVLGVASADVFPVRSDGRDCSSDLAAVIAALPDGGEVVFAAGRHRLESVVGIDGKKRLTLRGEAGAEIVVHANATGTVNSCNNAFHIRGCDDLRLENLVFTTDAPVNAVGNVVAVDPAQGTFDVELAGDVEITGLEHVACMDSCDDKGLRDGIFELNGRLLAERGESGSSVYRVGGVAFEKVGPKRLRFVAPGGTAFDFSRLTLPHCVAIRYSLWGGGMLTFDGVRGAVLRDIRIVRCNAMAAVINLGSSDFRFERFVVGDSAETGYSANSDGIHVVGLSGRLELIDCHFYGLGDDALNVHSRAGIVDTWNAASGQLAVMTRAYDGRKMPLPASWAESGDELAVYDAGTFLKRGVLKLSTWQAGVGVVENPECRLSVGDIVANVKHSPAVRIENSTCTRMRARAFLLQTSDVVVDSCTFRDVTYPALLFSPDIDRWYEMAPSREVMIRRSTFENCGVRDGSGAIAFRTSHTDGEVVRPAGVHADVTICDNTFKLCGRASISLASVSRVTLKGNVFRDSGRLRAKNCEQVNNQCR